jgi:hypothetical protein
MQAVACRHLACLNPNPEATARQTVLGRARHSVRAVCGRHAAGRGLPALPSWLTGSGLLRVSSLFRFLYFYRLEADLDLDEDVEEERR